MRREIATHSVVIGWYSSNWLVLYMNVHGQVKPLQNGHQRDEIMSKGFTRTMFAECDIDSCCRCPYYGAVCKAKFDCVHTCITIIIMHGAITTIKTRHYILLLVIPKAGQLHEENITINQSIILFI